MISGTSYDPYAAAAAQSQASAANDPAATKQMFLQLLVSQIKNQNPLNPADPAEFLSQLTQFSSVEQMLAMRQELESIRGLLELATAPGGSETGTESTSESN